MMNFINSYFLAFFCIALMAILSTNCQDNTDDKKLEDVTIVDLLEINEKNKNATTIGNGNATLEVIKSTPKTKTYAKKTDVPQIVCPGKDVRVPFFSFPCKRHKDCTAFGIKGFLCCSTRCLQGVLPPKPEPVHSPALFGLVERVCPLEPIPELLDVKECETDEECSPRICCPEKMLTGEVIGFCRTAEPKFDRLPRAKRLLQPLRSLMGYMQCTPPPPPILDVFPKACQNPLDCFPNLCCQERGKKFCRPPKRSLISLVATVGQRLVPENAARNFISRLN